MPGEAGRRRVPTLAPARPSLAGLAAWGGAHTPLLVVAAAALHAALVRASDVRLANHDVGWFLHAGATWLDGGRIGVDVIDTNPPLVIWLSGLEVALARALGATPFAVHASLSAALLLASVLLAGPALRRTGVPPLAVSAFQALFVSGGVLLAGASFGQREQWIAALLLPYACWAFADAQQASVRERAGTRALRVLAGSAAGLALCLKPHYALALAGIEAVRLAEGRGLRGLLRSEPLAAAAIGLLYVASLPWLAPFYAEDLRTTLGVYQGYDRGVPLFSGHTAALGAALAAALAARRAKLGGALPLALAVVAAAGWLAVLLQGKNFVYHHIPTDVFVLATFALLASLGLAAPGAERKGLATAALLALALGLAVEIERRLAAAPRSEERVAQQAAFDRWAAGDAVLVLSTGVHRLFPAVNFSRAHSASPYPCLWPIPGSYTPAERAAAPFRYRAWSEMTPIEKRLVARIVEVLASSKPRLVAVDVAGAKQGFGHSAFQFLPYFSAHPRFDPLFARYERVAAEGGFDYYLRRD
jgi:hypothetical protein